MNEIIELLNKRIKDINIDYWFAQWEYMQNAYIPYRNERFEFVNNLIKYLFKNRDSIKILDIGCGLLSFSGRFLNYWENIHIVGIDNHPVLYCLAKRKFENYKNIEIKLIDIRNNKDYVNIKDDNFDLAISSTALHWLSINNLERVIGKSFLFLAHNGYFMNIDHIRNENNEIQEFVDNERIKIAEKEFKNSNIRNWKNFFNDFYSMNNIMDLKEKIETNIGEWEGIETGLTFHEFKEIMENAGFKEIDCVWQYLNDRILICKKE